MRSATGTARLSIQQAGARGDDARGRLLDAAIRVYAQHGYQGATTRGIAAEAGVNEVTLFRIFGSKDALLDEAIARFAEPGDATRLPAEPRDPVREVAAWFRSEVERVRETRALMRQCFAGAEEHPRHVQRAAGVVDDAAAELRAYVGRLVKAGSASAAPRQRDAAMSLLLSALVTDALGRDYLATLFRLREDDAATQYARIFVGALAGD